MKRSFLVVFWLWSCGSPAFESAMVVDDAADGGGPSSDAATVDVMTEMGDEPDGRGGSGSSSGGSAGSSSGGSGGSSGSSSGGSSGSSGAPCDGGPYITHDDGLGQTWKDCAPLGTATQAEATAACNAYCAHNDGGACYVAGLDPSCRSFTGEMFMVCAQPNVFTGWSWWAPRPVMRLTLPGGTCAMVGMWQ